MLIKEFSDFIINFEYKFKGLLYTLVLTSSSGGSNVDELPLPTSVASETKPLLQKNQFNRFRKRTYSFH